MDNKQGMPPPYAPLPSSPAPHQFQPQDVPYAAPAGMPQPQPTTTQTTVVVNTAPGAVGGMCPVCRAGVFESGFTCCGWCWCILCFPIGIICCLALRKKSCTNCGFRAH